MISFEVRKELKTVGLRLLLVMLIFSFVSVMMLSFLITIPFIRSMYDEIMTLSMEGQSISPDALMEDLLAYIQEHQEDMTLYTYIVSAVCSVLAALAFLRPLRRAGHTFSALYAKSSFSWKHLGLAVLGAVGLGYAGSMIVLLTETLYNQFGLTILLAEAVPDFSPTALIYALLIAPVMEEFIFRGGVLRLLRPKGERFALMASALCFAAFHGNLHQIPTAFLLGLLMGYLAIRTDSLLPPTLTHIGYNAIITCVSAIPDSYAAVVSLILIASIVGGIWACKTLRKRMGAFPTDVTPPDIRAAFHFSLPMMLFWSFCLFSIVQNVMVY